MVNNPTNKLKRAINDRGPAMLGLDPAPEQSVDEIIAKIDAARDQVCGFKPNRKFYPSDQKLKIVTDYIHQACPEHALVVDEKATDIGNTIRNHVLNVKKDFNPDFVTVCPYVGPLSVIKAYTDADIGVFSMVANSNSDAWVTQNGWFGGMAGKMPKMEDGYNPKKIAGGIKYYQYMALRALEINPEMVHLVLGCNMPEQIMYTRAVLMEYGYSLDNMPFMLLPGSYSQEGSDPFVAAMLSGNNSVFPASRAGDKVAQLREDVTAGLKEYNPLSLRDIVMNNVIDEKLFDLVASPDKPITLKSEKKSFYYANMRQMQAYAEWSPYASHLMAKRVLEKFPDATAIAYVPDGANNIAIQSTMFLGMAPLTIRPPSEEEKKHGKGGRFIGPKKGKLVILDDTGTTGGSLKTAAQAAIAAGYEVIGCIVVVDRKEGAEQVLDEMGGLSVEHIYTAEELLSRIADESHPTWNSAWEEIERNKRELAEQYPNYQTQH